MRNFISAGTTATFLNSGSGSAAIASGAGVLKGGLFGVAANGAQVGDECVLNLIGVYDLPKAASQAWTFGQVVYWNDTTKVATTVATDAVKIGVAVEPVAGGATNLVGRVRLNGAF